ncbi:cysteine desulfurase [Motilibacter peucedani]|uniref:Cysteine desulfurase n=1 Tax=Motilibacter peucedani TaxID=598650 RepID=A0A420XLW7_9ACTN|nr:cysteine desulfurase [Motilibacter peucedani]
MAYLDHAATTPLRPEAAEVLSALLPTTVNPASLHASGRRARRTLEEAREQLARVVSCRPGEVVFTGSGTEADNLAVKGLYWSRRDADPRRRRVVVSAVEHAAVLEAAHWLERSQGAEVVTVPVDGLGRTDVDALRSVLDDDPGTVALVSVMWANNEVGTVQPLAQVVEAAARHGVPVHADAVQALGALPIDFAASGLAALTVSGHKVGGPVGTGALVLGRAEVVTPVLHGGGQERDVRSGTLAAASLAAFATAAACAEERRPVESRRLAGLRDELERRVLSEVPDAVVNGDRGNRLPGVAHLTFPGCEGDALLMLLDARGVECSTGSACTAGVPEPSEVLLAMGLGAEAARGSLRFSLGWTSTSTDVDELVEAIGPAVARARRAGLVTTGA